MSEITEPAVMPEPITTPEPSAIPEAVDATVKTDAPKIDTDTPVSPKTSETAPEWTPVTDNIKYSGLKFGGVDVEVEVPADIANFVGEKGVDIEAVSKELYESEDFTLSEATLEGLYEAFPKWQVDAYLSGVKAKNEAMINSHKTDVETRTANEETAWNSTMEIMGGEDRWEDMSAYASANLSPEDVAEFNSVMETGSLRMQQLMIKDLYAQFSTAGAPKAPAILDLEEGANSGDARGATGTALTASAYLDLIKTGEYKKDPGKYDALRRAGMKKGI